MSEEKERKPPVKEGDILELTVCGFGKTGDPMVKKETYVLFIKNCQGITVLMDQEMEIKVTKVLPNFGFAEMIG